MNEPLTQAALDAERSVLGAVLSAASLDVGAGFRTLDRIAATGLGPEHFYLASYGALYGRMLSLRERDVPLDPVSIGHELELEGARGDVVGRLHELAHEVTATSPCARWAEIVVQAARRRRTP